MIGDFFAGGWAEELLKVKRKKKKKKKKLNWQKKYRCFCDQNFACKVNIDKNDGYRNWNYNRHLVIIAAYIDLPSAVLTISAYIAPITDDLKACILYNSAVQCFI